MSEQQDRAEFPPDRFTALWRRLKDHRIAQWTVGYVAVAYGIQHAVTLTSEAYEWPNIVARLSMTLLALGLPLAVTVAWYHGERVSRRVSGGEAAIVSVLLILVSLVFYVFVRPAPEAALALRTASIVASAPANGISLAVLPFVNLSSDKEQEFFSDGITEEITTALAKVPDLRVVGRTSAFQFKGQNKDLRAIGQALSATHLIEGSVRKDGNQLRITAQLVRADDGTHLWAESYDRELKGVFAVQEEIAQAIAASLQVPLGLKKGQSLISNRTTDTDSYQDYLRARALVRARGPLEPGPLSEAIKLLEQVVARDSNYAPAWALLGYAYDLSPIYDPAVFNGSIDDERRIAAEALHKGETAAQRAIRLDPGNVDGYFALGIVRDMRGEFAEAEDLYKKSLALDPGNSDALHRYGTMLAAVGRIKDAVPLRLRLQAQEPFVPTFNIATAYVLFAAGRNNDAVALLKSMQPTFLARVFLAEIYASMGRYAEAAGSVADIPPDEPYPAAVITEAVRVLRNAPAKPAALQAKVRSGMLGFIYVYAGDPTGVLDFYEQLAEAGYPAVGDLDALLWAQPYAAARRTERFKTYARKAGLTNYWRARGWPDLCHPTTGDDFVCN
jgi:TolB-like protein/Tfp pilus assembly protein PilF